MSCNYKTNIKDIQSKYTFKIFCAGDTSQIEQEIGNLSDLTTTAKNNLVSAINEVDGDLSAKEDKSNKVTTITSSSTDTQYPSAKLLYNQLALKEDVANKTTTLSSSSTNTQYPSAKAVYDSQVAQDTIIDQTKEELDYYKTIYNVLPKVSGNGENITLNNTGESILKLDTRGQCKQDSTTGKNKLNTTLATTTLNGITCTRNDDGTYTLNGTATAGTSFTLTSPNPTLSAGTYKLVGVKNGSYSTFSLRAYNSANSLLYVDIGSGVTFTTNEDLAFQIFIDIANGTTLSNVIVKPMITTDTSLTYDDFEPYTGGIPAPNPSYPYPIHEVSGDNEIVVCGRNLTDESVFNQYVQTPDDEAYILYNSSVYNKNLTPNITFKENTQYTIQYTGKQTSGNPRLKIVYTDNTSQVIGSDSISTSYTTYTQTSNASKTISHITEDYGGSGSMYIKKGSVCIIEGTDTTYYPYNGDTYELDLGVENLFDKDNPSSLVAYITSEGVITSANDNYGVYLKVKKNTDYTMSITSIAKSTSSYVDDVQIGLYASQPALNSTGTRIYSQMRPSATQDYTHIHTFNTGNNEYVYIKVANTTRTELTETLATLQLEEGTKANSYSPYGQTPIKMRGIGTYEDYFVRNSGKNLLDLTDGTYSENGINVVVNNGEITISGTATDNMAVSIPLKEMLPTSLGTLTKSLNAIGTYTNLQTSLRKSDKNFGGLWSNNGANQTGTLEADCYYFGVQVNNGVSVNCTLKPQVELGSSSSTYEPYGTGQWCKYNAIGKEIFGNLYIRTWTSTYYGLYFYTAPNNIRNGSVVLSDIYKQVSATPQTWVDYTMTIDGKNIQIKDSRYTSVSDYQEAVYNNFVYYQLEVPYLSPIENETLISQLDKIEKALGKSGQTNISQVNNDAPFKIYASALMKISGE